MVEFYNVHAYCSINLKFVLFLFCCVIANGYIIITYSVQFIWPRNPKRNGKPLTISKFSLKSDTSIAYPWSFHLLTFSASVLHIRTQTGHRPQTHTRKHTFTHKNFTKQNTKLLTKPIDRQIPK